MGQVYIFLAVFSFNAYKSLVKAPGLDSGIRVVTALTDAAIILLALVRLHRSEGFYGGRFLIVLLFGAVLTIIINLDRISLTAQLSALREPLFFLACLVVVNDILRSDYAGRFTKYFLGMLIMFCLAQIPSSFLQFLKYGASDWVGGTLGWGATNVVTLLVFILTFFFIVVYGSSPESDDFSLKKILLFSLLLFPSMINETKISFILLPIFFALLTFTPRIHRLVPIALVGIGLFSIFALIYSENVQSTDRLLDEAFLERYLFHDKRENVDIPRGQKLTMTLDMMSQEPHTYFLGFGYGSLTRGRLMETSQFTRSVWWMKGAQAFLNTAWFQGGLLLVVCLAFPMFKFLRSKQVYSRNMRRFRLFLAFVLAAMWLYHPSLFNRTFAAIIAFVVLWTDRGGVDRADDTLNEGEDGLDGEGEDMIDETPLQMSNYQ